MQSFPQFSKPEHPLSVFALLVKVLFTSLLLFQASVLQAGDTYFTDDDNENNGGLNFSDNDMDVSVNNTDGIHPIDFDIDVTGALPSSSATLIIEAFDIDEEAGENDQAVAWQRQVDVLEIVLARTANDEFALHYHHLTVGFVASLRGALPAEDATCSNDIRA